MHILSIFRIIGILVMCFSATMLVPAFVALIYGDGGGKAFMQAFIASFSFGTLLWWSCHQHKQELRAREGFLIVVSFWVLLSLLAVIPFLLFDEVHMDFADTVFEAFSALTTTGATVMSGLDNLPKSILFYRQFLQWLGGMGLIVLVVAVIPILGIGGTQLYRIESSGPMKDQKNLPRIAEVAKLLWLLYCLLTIISTLGYWWAGMSFFDALCHSFSTVSNGGMSTHDANLGYFKDNTIYFLSSIFMLAAGCNFGLHAMAFTQIQYQSIWKTYWHDPEFRFFCLVQGFFILVISFGLYISYDNLSLIDAFAQGSAQSASMAMTSGYTLFDFNQLPSFLGMMLVFAGLLGGCAGSTSGGLKMIRVLVVWLQFKRELKSLVHPNLVVPVKLGDNLLSMHVIERIWAFLIAFFLTFWLCVFAAILCGMGAFDSIGAVFAAITNAGPGLGIISTSFADVPDSAKYVFSFAMVAGRLEVFSLLVLFSPTFWRT
ncbi:TrkH family potassium uptake protein [Avibacterium volantium]|uniref:TrkH family potassium uptake protein n=1 Tax=Avibacterium TaxID=292486 RepID=UPI0039FD0BD4